MKQAQSQGRRMLEIDVELVQLRDATKDYDTYARAVFDVRGLLAVPTARVARLDR